MTTTAGRVNRGPAAAAGNREALLAAARRLFAARGYHVPLSAIAREAGVGQGVLYRHFPTRIDLALAVFEQNFAELDQIAADPGPDAFGRLWDRLIDLILTDTAVIELVIDARRTLPGYEGDRRLAGLVARTLPAALAAGLVPDRLGVPEVMLVLRMVVGVVVTAADDPREAVRAALALTPLGPAPLRPAPPPA
ncbi:TetR/AcrR family transcriptional regulator [Cellulomonas denverensis]|uniref:Helix-turn-helix transcriptional regulator n=1 Tax=Cellulomonas denverensis TaxID=264297 RepID=A0A7X6QYW2_9CELL|nr:TetR/AcrR family transcriptional regulator [Cellulomonas denverensis]NKY22436.1 helix-turn-helix transcriptional regulator [Cellulomonas denverensis]GIG25909.1 hypothetical protein Cde04nite_21530 [Cellulomonas denverensis]